MQVRCDFTLCQKDESTLLKCKAFFDNQIQKLGTKEPMLQDFKPKKDGSYYLKISRQTILLQVIKPLFQECPLLSEKFQDYQLFFAVLEIYTNPNLEKRVRVLYAAYLMFAMNTKGNQRKRNLNDYERILKPAFKSDHEWDIALSQVLKYKQDVLSIPFVDFNKPGILSDDYIVGLIVGDGSFQSYFAMSKTRPGILQRTFDLTLEVADQNLLLFYAIERYMGITWVIKRPKKEKKICGVTKQRNQLDNIIKPFFQKNRDKLPDFAKKSFLMWECAEEINVLLKDRANFSTNKTRLIELITKVYYKSDDGARRKNSLETVINHLFRSNYLE